MALYTDCTIAVSINLSAIKLRSATEGKDNVHSSRPANTMRVKRTRGLLTDRTPAGSGRSWVPHADCDTPGKSTAGRWSRYFATRTRLRVLFWDHYDVGARWSRQCHRPCKSFERGRNRFLRAFRLMAGVIEIGLAWPATCRPNPHHKQVYISVHETRRVGLLTLNVTDYSCEERLWTL